MGDERSQLITKLELDRTVRALERDFEGVFGPETITRFVDESLERWPNANVKGHIQLLAYRFAKERLQALGQAEGMIAKDKPEVLFGVFTTPGVARWPPHLPNIARRDRFELGPLAVLRRTRSTQPSSP